MTTILAFVFVIGVLVFVHELGHFLAARRVGIRVLTFSIGFGPRIVGFTRGGTDYCISAVPLGGFVKMAGETTDSPDAPPTGKADEFLSKTKWERFQVLIMGPVMNLVLAVGYANTISVPVPGNVTVQLEGVNKVHVSGADKQAVGEFAARVRRLRKPEPYKGKGIRYEGEVVKIKPGKAFAGAGAAK